MNFYQLDVYEIERYIRNNSIEASTLTNVLLDKLKEVTGHYEQLTEVLEDNGNSIDPQTLEYDLQNMEGYLNDLKENVENLKHENDTLQNEINVLKETFANS